MKKKILLTLSCICLIIVTGCGKSDKKINTQESNNSDEKINIQESNDNIEVKTKYVDYEIVGYFSEKLAEAKKNGSIGFIDKEGNVIIDFEYDSA